MLTEKRTAHPALARYRLGIALLWLGVLTWLPFIVLRAGGSKPSFFWFLPFHLLGVVGGSRMQAGARREMGGAVPAKNAFRTVGRGLIFLGILVWGVYFYLKLVTGLPVDMGDFLPYHLTGIFGGIAALGAGYIINTRKQNQD